MEPTRLLYDYARYYDPGLGRFLSPDTIGTSPGNPQSLNRYSYVGNNPLIHTDPSGHCSDDAGCNDQYGNGNGGPTGNYEPGINGPIGGDPSPSGGNEGGNGDGNGGGNEGGNSGDGGIYHPKASPGPGTPISGPFIFTNGGYTFSGTFINSNNGYTFNGTLINNNGGFVFSGILASIGGPPVNGIRNPYPQITDPRTGNPIPFPEGTSHNRLTPEENARRLAEWDKVLVDRRRQYADTYGMPENGWYDQGKNPGGAQLHHVQPRQFGGSDELSNLVALSPTEHRVFNTWWSNW